MIDQFHNAIRQADELGPLLAPPQEVLSGFSGVKLIAALQRLSALFADKPGSCYLEVGVFQGLTLLSTAYANSNLLCYGIDNFAYFDKDGQNEFIVNQRVTALGLSNTHLINSDYEDALGALGSKIEDCKVGMYFVDGPHDYRSQRVCLDLALPYLDDHAVILIDDSNYVHVRQANYDFLMTNPEFKLIFEAYTPCHPLNMNASSKAIATEGWWNGVNIIARDPENRVPAMFPPTVRDRLLFENDHKLHSFPLARHLPAIANTCLSYIQAEALVKPKQVLSLLRSLSRLGKGLPEDGFAQGNTWSRDLPVSRFNPGLYNSGKRSE